MASFGNTIVDVVADLDFGFGQAGKTAAAK